MPPAVIRDGVMARDSDAMARDSDVMARGLHMILHRLMVKFTSDNALTRAELLERMMCLTCAILHLVPQIPVTTMVVDVRQTLMKLCGTITMTSARRYSNWDSNGQIGREVGRGLS